MNKFNKYTYLLLALLGAATLVSSIIAVVITLTYRFILSLF